MMPDGTRQPRAEPIRFTAFLQPLPDPEQRVLADVFCRLGIAHNAARDGKRSAGVPVNEETERSIVAGASAGEELGVGAEVYLGRQCGSCSSRRLGGAASRGDAQLIARGGAEIANVGAVHNRLAGSDREIAAHGVFVYRVDGEGRIASLKAYWDYDKTMRDAD